MKQIYVDNAATTQISEDVLQTMLPYLKEGYGNASSIYKLGRDAEAAIEKARTQVAIALGADIPEPSRPVEIYFTGCGSESDNWALKSIAHHLAKKGKKHIITSAFEHHAILHTCERLAKEGFSITYLPITADGYVRVEDVANAIRPDTALVSIMYANNEIGTIQPIAEIGALCKAQGVLFHTDAVQAVGHVKIDVKAQNIDLLSLSGHKIHAPKGIGVLYCRKGILLENFMDGGGQERGKRAGTENVAAIVALGRAIEIATANIEETAQKTAVLRDRLVQGLQTITHSRINGGLSPRLPGNLNMSFIGVEGESLLLQLDSRGICASSGSACTSGSLDPSHVLLALGLSHEWAHGSLRLTLGEGNTAEDVDAILEAVPVVVEKIRAMSPLWEKIIKDEKEGK